MGFYRQPLGRRAARGTNRLRARAGARHSSPGPPGPAGRTRRRLESPSAGGAHYEFGVAPRPAGPQPRDGLRRALRQAPDPPAADLKLRGLEGAPPAARPGAPRRGPRPLAAPPPPPPAA